MVNNAVFVTTYGGTIYGIDAKSGHEVWSDSLPAASNTGLAVSGNTMIVPAGTPAAEGQRAEIVAYRLGGG